MEKEGVGMALPIAIVEDQTPDAQRLEELLQQQLPEAECTWFTCGDDFLRAAAEPGLYAVVFLDICMAGTNGIETARRLRQAYGAFDLVTDPDLVEAWIFEISAQRARYSYLLKQRKRLEQASDEAAQGGAAAE